VPPIKLWNGAALKNQSSKENWVDTLPATTFSYPGKQIKSITSRAPFSQETEKKLSEDGKGPKVILKLESAREKEVRRKFPRGNYTSREE